MSEQRAGAGGPRARPSAPDAGRRRLAAARGAAARAGGASRGGAGHREGRGIGWAAPGAGQVGKLRLIRRHATFARPAWGLWARFLDPRASVSSYEKWADSLGPCP